MSIYRVETSLTTASGSISGNTLPIGNGLCRQVLIYSANTDTTFDLSIIDNGNRTVRYWGNVTYQVNDLATFPMSGIYTVSINNSSADEPFTVLLGIQDGV